MFVLSTVVTALRNLALVIFTVEVCRRLDPPRFANGDARARRTRLRHALSVAADYFIVPCETDPCS